METSIVGVGVSITDRFRTVVEDKSARIAHYAPRAQRLDVKVTHRAYHNGRMEDDVAGNGGAARVDEHPANPAAITAAGRIVEYLQWQIVRGAVRTSDAGGMAGRRHGAGRVRP